jgi:predicted RNA binding protein with dsRBD fold (UPF0201 family)
MVKQITMEYKYLDNERITVHAYINDDNIKHFAELFERYEIVDIIRKFKEESENDITIEFMIGYDFPYVYVSVYDKETNKNIGMPNLSNSLNVYFIKAISKLLDMDFVMKNDWIEDIDVWGAK